MKTNLGTHHLQLQRIFANIEIELNNAVEKFDAFNSAHEGYAVLLEEVNELWQEVIIKDQSKEKMYNEAKQVATMAIRFIIDISGDDFYNEHKIPDND